MNPTRSHYEMLGVAPDADAAAVKAAYRKLVKTMHPDVGGNSALFGMITEAKDCLSDPSRRAKYDRDLAAGGTGDDQALRAAQAAAAAAQRDAHDAEAGRLAAEALLRQARAQGRPTPETGDAHADEVAQYVELLHRMDLNREQARRAEEERENSRQDWLDHRLDRRRARRLAVARLPAATVRAVWHHPRWGALTVVALLVVGVGVGWGPALYHDFRCPATVASVPAGHPSADKLLAFAKSQICRGSRYDAHSLYAPRPGGKGFPDVVNKEHPAPIYWDARGTAWEGLATPTGEPVVVAGVRGYAPADTPAGKAPAAFSESAIIVEASGACSYIDAKGPSVIPLKPCPAAWAEPTPAPPTARQFSGPPEKPSENLAPNTSLKLVPHGCVTLAASQPSSADRLPAFTLTTWEGAPLASWDPKSAALTAAVGDILTYEITVPKLARGNSGMYYIDGTLTTRYQGFGGDATLSWKGEAPVCAGPPKAAPRGFAAGHWINHNPVAPANAAATPVLSTTGCVTRPKNPKLSTLPAFTVTQAGTAVATWDVKTGTLRGPVGGITAYDFALSFAADGRAHVAGTIARLDTDGQTFTGTWPVCP